MNERPKFRVGEVVGTKHPRIRRGYIMAANHAGAGFWQYKLDTFVVWVSEGDLEKLTVLDLLAEIADE